MNENINVVLGKGLMFSSLLVLIKNENWMLIIRKYLVHFSLMFRRLLAAFYDLLIAKLYAYGFRLAALQFIKGQISKIN